MKRSLDSTEAVLKILETLEKGTGCLSVRKIAECSGITKSTAHRILQDLTSIGWTYQDEEDKNYYIGLKFLSLANAWRTNMELVQQFDPVLRKVMSECRQTVFLNIIDGDRAVCLHRIESDSLVRIASSIGQENPLHAGASGKTLLAYAPERLITKILSSKLEAFTPFTVTDRVILKEQLKGIREKGFCASVEEIDPGVAAVAIPVFAKTDEAAMALTVAGTRFDYEREGDTWLSALIKITKDLVPGSL